MAPCAIVLVQRGDEVLLTRKPEWAPNRYGLVAGFVEFGEALEQHFLKRTAGIEVAFDRQRLDQGNVLPLSSASAYSVRVDIN
ncbi:MAG: hypothetical protein NHG36_06485, partial [Chromatiaceae bacterium]|nr:hypothetical protein [Candidatus Thioaporhodococcus sediminis]